MKVLLDTDIGKNIDDAICRFEKGNVEVEIVAGERADSQPRHEVAVEVSSDRFFTHFVSMF